MIKHILFICLLLGSFISGKCQLIIQGNSSNQLARFAELETLDNSSMECIYRHRTTDPALSERRVAYEILQNGADYSKYWEYGRYQIDSVLASITAIKLRLSKPTEFTAAIRITPPFIYCVINRRTNYRHMDGYFQTDMSIVSQCLISNGS